MVGATQAEAREADEHVDGRPRISVLIPCYNEEDFIGACLDSVLDEYVLSACEILVIDGRSTDRTRQVVEEYSERHGIVHLLDNPHKLQSQALNVGLERARGEVIVRLDAHSIYPTGYVQRCVELLDRSDAANVGGVMLPRGEGLFHEAVAKAMKSRIGIGGSKFHLGTYSGYVDTVYLGTFRREIFDRVGGYDMQAHPAEDAELNCRILGEGERIFLDSSLKVEYTPRDTFSKLAKQFFWYGRARCYVILKHGRVFTPGRLMPPLLVLGIIASLLLAPFYPVMLVIPLGYAAAMLAGAASLAAGSDRLVRRVAAQWVVLMTMHLAYGTGFLLKLLGILR